MLSRQIRSAQLSDFAHVTSPILRSVLELWLLRRCERLMANRRDIDPVDLRGALPHIWICDVLPGDCRFRYRLAGEAINEAYGYSLKSKYLDEIIPRERYEIIHNRYLAVAEMPAILHTRGRVYLRNDRCLRGERLMLPLSTQDGQTTAQILGVTVITEFLDWDKASEAKRQQVAVGVPLLMIEPERGIWSEEYSGMRQANEPPLEPLLREA